jgi:hypothetical protein
MNFKIVAEFPDRSLIILDRLAELEEDKHQDRDLDSSDRE